MVPVFAPFGFFDQEGEWVKLRKATGYSFDSHMSQVRNGHLKNHIHPKFGEQYLDEIEAFEIENWLLKLNLSGQTKSHIRYSFDLVFQEAKRNKVVKNNVLKDVRKFAKNHRRRDAFSLEESKRLFSSDRSALCEIWGEFFWAVAHYLMLTTGMRVGEIAALLWCHIVWEKRGILILQAVKADRSIGQPKKNSPHADSRRAALLPKKTHEMLHEWYNMTPFSEPDHYVFFSGEGNRHFHPRTIQKVFPSALEKAGIQIEGRYLGAHSLRHTYNQRMRYVLPESILRYMIGHKTGEMTDWYDKSLPERKLDDLVSRIGQIEDAWS